MRTAKTSAVSAIWMSQAPAELRGSVRSAVDGEVETDVEGDVLTEGRTELDLLEAMETERHLNKYVPNVHYFAPGHIFASQRNVLDSDQSVNKNSWSLNFGKYVATGCEQFQASWAVHSSPLFSNLSSQLLCMCSYLGVHDE